MKYTLTKENLIVLETESNDWHWSKTLVSGNSFLIREMLHLANLALEHRAAVKAQREDVKMKGFENMPVRFFVYVDEESDLVECEESDFLACEYPISYERNTVFANGVNQICLTKMPDG